jgi:cystathionine beta-lyase
MPNAPQNRQPFKSLSPAVHRASTIVFDTLEDFVGRKSRQPDGYSYGVTGTPTHRELEAKIASLEDGKHCVVVPSGQAALAASVLTFVRAGDHLLISDASYGGLKAFARNWMSNLGIDVEVYAPAIGGDIEALIKPNTKMICLETPGTITMEMADIPAIVAAAKRHAILTMIDNTWASPLAFRPLQHGVDISVEAATKFFGGHSDLLMGSISVRDSDLYEQLREAQATLGLAVSADDCFLVLRGMETFRLRFDAQSANALSVARWLSAHPLVQQVLLPALESDPGHAIWKRDFTGSGCLFSVILKPAPEAAFTAFFDALRVFSIGASWGGVRALIAYYPAALQKGRKFSLTDQPVVRISIGLEDPLAMIEDLKNGLAEYSKFC